MEQKESKLIQLIQKYEELRALKDEIAEAKTEIEEEFKKIQSEIVEQMVEDDVPSQGYGGFNYSPQTVVHYNFKAEDTLLAEGKDKLQIMRDNGFDFLIKETINQRSLESALKDYVKNDPDGELPEEVADIISSYDELKIRRTKTRKGTMDAAKAAVNKAKGVLEG